MENKYYIYILFDSSKSGEYIYGEYVFQHEPFYVGKGCGGRYKNTLYDKSPFKRNKIDKLIREGIEIFNVKIIEHLSNKEAISSEIELISLIGRRDLNKGTLVNQTDGGDGRLSSKHTDETKAKISKSKKGQGLGRKASDKSKKLMSLRQTGENNGFYGKKHTEINKDVHSLRISGDNHPMFGKKHSDGTIRKIITNRDDEKLFDVLRKNAEVSKKEVLMFSLDMNFIKEFDSVKSASSETSINESIISKCCRGEIITPTRYFFKYKKHENIIKQNRYLININDYFIHNGVKYILNKRNRTSAMCVDIVSDKLVTIRYKDCTSLTFKDTNDSEFVELFIYIKSISDNFKIDRKKYLIYSKDGSIKIFYKKLLLNSGIFPENENIPNDYADKENYKIISVSEDSWRNKKEIIKSHIKNIINYKNENI